MGLLHLGHRDGADILVGVNGFVDLSGGILHRAAQRVLKLFQAPAQVAHAVQHSLQIALAVLQILQCIFHVCQIFSQGGNGIHHAVEGGLGAGNGLAQSRDLALHRLQHIRQIGKIRPQGIGAAVDGILAAGEDVPGLIQLIQTVGGCIQAAGHGRHGVQQGIHAAGELVVVLLQIVLPFGQLGDLLKLAQRGRHHQEGHAAKGEIVAAHPDGVMTFLAGQADEQHRPQVADQLHLCAGRFQRQDVVLIEDGHGFQRVVVPGVFAGRFIGDGVQIDLHHAGLACQILRLGGNAVEGVAHGQRPGQLLKGLRRFALEIEGAGQIALIQLEHGLAVRPGRLGAVGQVDDLIIVAVVRQCGDAVGAVALDHAAVGQVAIIIRHGVVCLVIGGGHTVIDGGRRNGAKHHQGGQGAASDPQKLPFHGFHWFLHRTFFLYDKFQNQLSQNCGAVSDPSAPTAFPVRFPRSVRSRPAADRWAVSIRTAG